MNELNRFDWIKVEDWSMLAPSEYSTSDEAAKVTKKDIYNFIDSISGEVARKLDYGQNYIITNIKAANIGCINYVNRVFRFKSYPLEHDAVKAFKEMFRIPKVDKYSVDKVTAIYNTLSDEEQKEFLNQIRKL